MAQNLKLSNCVIYSILLRHFYCIFTTQRPSCLSRTILEIDLELFLPVISGLLLRFTNCAICRLSYILIDSFVDYFVCWRQAVKHRSLIIYNYDLRCRLNWSVSECVTKLDLEWIETHLDANQGIAYEKNMN